MITTTAQTARTIYSFVIAQIPKIKDLLIRIWLVVKEIFTCHYEKKVPLPLAVKKISPLIMTKLSLEDKLNLFQKMPKAELLFLQKTVSNYRTIFKHQDRILAHQLGLDERTFNVRTNQWISELKTTDDYERYESLPCQLHLFNVALQNRDPFIFKKILAMALRAFLFCNDVDQMIPSYFSHGKKEGKCTYDSELHILKAQLSELPDSEKEILLESPSNQSKKLVLSKEGEIVFEKIEEISSRLVQGNSSFFAAFPKIR